MESEQLAKLEYVRALMRSLLRLAEVFGVSVSLHAPYDAVLTVTAEALVFRIVETGRKEETS
jgi:signal transduction histidine kinase